MSKRHATDDERTTDLERRRARLLTVKEYAMLTREHTGSVYRRVHEGRQAGVHRIGSTAIRLEPPDDDTDE